MMLLLTSKALQYWVLAIAASVSAISFLAFQVLGQTPLGKIHDFQIIETLRDNDNGNFDAFELEGITIAQSFPPYPREFKHSDERLAWLLGTLDGRLKPLSDASERPSCALDLDRYDTILRSASTYRQAHPISIAINLHNSQHVLPAQMKALLTAISHLLPKHAVYLSIYENESRDTTPQMLGHFAAALERIGVDGLWIVASHMRSGITNANRINMLAEFRNAALRPLLPYAGSGTIVFINDVILCASDVLEVIMQLQVQSADAVVGVDWCDSSADGPSPPYVYDAWVLRGINGAGVYEQNKTTPWPVPPPKGQDWISHAFSTQDTPTHERWLNNLPFPVYAGWGGIVALQAELFTKQGLRFRSSKVTGWTGGSVSGSMGPWGQLVTNNDYLNSDCPGDSECGLVMRDVWNLRQGKARIVLASAVVTAYSMHVWKAARLFLPFVAREDRIYPGEIIDWQGVNIPREVMCMPSRTSEGVAHDAHDTKLFRYLSLDPFFEATATAKPAVAYSR